MAAPKAFSVTEHDWESQAYVDEWISRDIQRDEQRRPRLRQMLSYAPQLTAAEPRILDVGGGYGVVTEEVLRAFPQAQVTLQDYSQPMLRNARARLSRYGAQVQFVQADLLDAAWVDRVGGPFDLAVSSIAIHNLRDTAAIAGSYRGIARVLHAGSAFLNCDLVDYVGGLALHIDLMRQAGFASAECVWHEAPLAIIVGVTATAA